MTICRLTSDDFDSMKLVRDSTTTYHGYPLVSIPNGYPIPPTETVDTGQWDYYTKLRLADNDINFFYGSYNEANELLAFTHFQKWWDKELNAISWLATFSNKNIKKPRAKNLPISQAVIDVSMMGFNEFFYVDYIFSSAPTSMTWTPWLKPTLEILGKTATIETMEIVPKNENSKNPLYTKYVLKTIYPYEMKVTRVTPTK